jgi:hypothetical protein
MGRMRCLNAMAEWKRLAELSEELWKMPSVGTTKQQQQQHTTTTTLTTTTTNARM